MNDSSDDDSSDSSTGFLVNPEKINLDSSFFSDKASKRITVETNVNEFSDSDDFQDSKHESSVELFSQVLKNLEATNKHNDTNESDVKHENPSLPGTTKSKINESASTASCNEINELLLQGENGISSFEQDTGYASEKNEEDEGTQSTEYTIPKDGVKIILPGAGLLLNRKKRGCKDVEAVIRSRIRAAQILVEKVGLLCWLAYGFHLNRLINQPEITYGAFSLISANDYPKEKISLSYLKSFTTWFHKLFTFEEDKGNGTITKEVLLERLKDKKILDYKELVLLYVATLRAIGINCRLIISLNPPHRKLHVVLPKIDPKNEENRSKEKPVVSKKSKGKDSKKRKGNKKELSEKKSSLPENSPEGKRNANLDARKRAAEVLRSKQDSKASNSQNTTNTRSKDKAHKESGSKLNEKDSMKIESTDTDEKKSESNLRQLRSRKVLNETKEDTKKRARVGSKKDGTTSKHWKKEDTDSEEEFQPKPKLATKRKLNKSEEQVSDTKDKKKNRKLLSSDDEDENEENQGKNTEDMWAEVYIESEESWISVSVTQTKVNSTEDIYKKAKKPVLYVIAWNSNGLIKDVTRRYCPQWLTVTRKQRIEEKWWNQTMSYWQEKNTPMSRAEDEMLLQKELEQPLPKTVGECKGHPLYALARHLLKYEALYPPDCVPLGHLKTGEAIYSRHCVHTLCSRETWLKKARVVKPNQEAYKIVKALPKYDKLSGMKIKDTALELFGHWQTMEYEPPEAKDGIVPRNEYGNVDLFKQCMLPKGTVHINLPGLNRIARKLNIDCAPAVVGFNFGCMGAVPAMEGYVVCSEYEDTLREAWEAEQIEAAKRAKEKREKRVYGNWKRFIHGLLIREKLAAKYEFSEEKKSALPNKRTKHKKTDTKKSKVL